MLAFLASAASPRPCAADPAPEPAPTFRSWEGGFAAPFPEAPAYEEKREATILGPLRSRSWEVARGSVRMRVERHDLPALATLLLADEDILERATRGLLEDAGADAKHAEPAPWREHEGRHLRYEPGDSPGATEHAWLYLLGRRLYVVFARGGDAAQRFAAGIELAEE